MPGVKPDAEQEAEANLFAVELLMPRAFLARDVPGPLDLVDETPIHALARRYGVPAHLMALRLAQLGYLRLP